MNISLQPQGVPEGESGPPPLQNGQEHCIHHTTYLVQSDFFLISPIPFPLIQVLVTSVPYFMSSYLYVIAYCVFFLVL